MEYESDILMALESLEDEIKGINEYKEMIESVEDKDLHRIFSELLATEKKHATVLLSWINSKAQVALK
jgi:hypothetical protein